MKKEPVYGFDKFIEIPELNGPIELPSAYLEPLTKFTVTYKLPEECRAEDNRIEAFSREALEQLKAVKPGTRVRFQNGKDELIGAVVEVDEVGEDSVVIKVGQLEWKTS